MKKKLRRKSRDNLHLIIRGKKGFFCLKPLLSKGKCFKIVMGFFMNISISVCSCVLLFLSCAFCSYCKLYFVQCVRFANPSDRTLGRYYCRYVFLVKYPYVTTLQKEHNSYVYIIIAIYPPKIYTAPAVVMFLIRAHPLRGQVRGGWALEIESLDLHASKIITYRDL
jgi:hypothetical protein